MSIYEALKKVPTTVYDDQVSLYADTVSYKIMFVGFVVAVLTGVAVWYWQSSKCSTKDDEQCYFNRNVWTMSVVFVVFFVFGMAASFYDTSRHPRAMIEQSVFKDVVKEGENFLDRVLPKPA